MRQNKTIMSFAADRDFAGKIERMIKATGSYSSKSEFLRDAARQRLVQMAGMEGQLSKMDEAMKKLRPKIKFVRELREDERDELAKDFIRKHYR